MNVTERIEHYRQLARERELVADALRELTNSLDFYASAMAWGAGDSKSGAAYVKAAREKGLLASALLTAFDAQVGVGVGETLNWSEEG